MRILLTGNLGYIGTVASPVFAQSGFDVVGLDTGYYREGILEPLGTTGLSRQIDVDIRDIEAEHLRGIDAVVHLAALSNDPTGELNPGLTEDINTRATIRLAELGRAAGVRRFIFASSCSIYGSSEAQALTESAVMNPQTAYARSKVDTEAALRDMAGDSFSPTYMRNATAYGFSPRLRFDVAVNNLTGWGLATGRVTLLSDGRAWRPFVHVRDIIAAMVAALKADVADVHNQAFNVGSPADNWQIRDVAEEVARALPGTSVVFGEGAGADNRNYNVSFDKILRVLPEYRPAWTVPAGIRELIDELRARGITREIFEGRHHTRLKQLRHLLEQQRVTGELRWSA